MSTKTREETPPPPPYVRMFTNKEAPGNRPLIDLTSISHRPNILQYISSVYKN